MDTIENEDLSTLLYPTIMDLHNINYHTLVSPEMMDEIPDHMCHVIEWDEVTTEEPLMVIHHRYKYIKN